MSHLESATAPPASSAGRRLVCLLVGCAVFLGTVLCAPTTSVSAATARKVLIFSKTAGFRHTSIPNGIAAIVQLGRSNGFTVTTTEDSGQFTEQNLAQYQAVIWLSTTGNVLSDAQRVAFEAHIAAGGGYVGIHAAADTGYDWPWYGGLVGSYFDSHPEIQQASVNVDDRATAATAHLGNPWIRSDEWYNFRTNPRTAVKVLLSLNEKSYTGGTMGDHPIAWCQNYGGGRAFYTGLGHTEASYSETDFTTFLLGGISIAAGWVTTDCTPSPQSLVSLRARANNRYGVAESGGSSALIANRTAVGQWEKFDLVERGGDTIALRSHANSSYVCAESAGNAQLIANRESIGAWESFTLIHNADGTVSLRAQANGRLVTAENAGAQPLVANRVAVGEWEKFDLVNAAVT
jgi:type 1 glutamine amidotransferase